MITSELEKKEEALWQKTEEWRKSGGFKHRNLCKEWLRGKRCSHFAKARYRHFKSDIDSVLQAMNLA